MTALSTTASRRDILSATAVRFDKDEIKRAATGRWQDILSTLADIPADLLDKSHYPCPACGGTDRFRALDDFETTGAVYCNGCFSSENGDGIAAIQHFGGLDFKTTLRKLAEYLGTPGRNGKPHTMNDKPKRQYVKGSDIIAFLESVQDEQAEASE